MMDSAGSGGSVDPALIVPLIPSSPPSSSIPSSASSDGKASTNDGKDYKGPSAKPLPVPPSLASSTPSTAAASTAKRGKRERNGIQKPARIGGHLTPAEKDPSRLTSFGMRSSAALQTGGLFSKIFGADMERKRRGSTSSDDNDTKVTPPQVFTGATIRVGALGEVDNEIRVIPSLNGGIAGPPPPPPQPPIVPPVVPAATATTTATTTAPVTTNTSGTAAATATNDGKTATPATTTGAATTTAAGVPATVATGAGRGAPTAVTTTGSQPPVNGPAAAPTNNNVTPATTAVAAAAARRDTVAPASAQPTPPPAIAPATTTTATNPAGGAALPTAAPQRADKQYWMSDKNCKDCFDCNLPFTIFRRKHHCRMCGQIFCHACSSQTVNGKRYNLTGHIRVCKHCFRLAQSTSVPLPRQLQTTTNGTAVANPSLPRHTDLGYGNQSATGDNDVTTPDPGKTNGEQPPAKDVSRPRSESSARKSGMNLNTTSAPASSTSDTSTTATGTNGTNGTATAAAPPKVQRPSLAGKLTRIITGKKLAPPAPILGADGKPISESPSPGPKGKKKPRKESADLKSEEKGGAAAGANATTTIDENDEESDGDGVADDGDEEDEDGDEEDDEKEGEPEMEGDIDEEEPTTDNILPGTYSPFQFPRMTSTADGGDGHTNGSGGPTDQTIEDKSSSTATAPEPNLPPSLDDAAMKDLIKARKRMQLVADMYLVSLISRLVNEQGLDARWIDTIMDLAQRAHTQVKPNVLAGDKMDILHYVKVKTVPGGKMEECMYVDGVVFMKNVAHKRMATMIPNARILLLRCPLEYHRVENRLSSLETLIIQETENIEIQVSKVLALKPDVLMVEKTVSRLAQDLLRDAGVTLIVNMKPNLMERLSRSTQAPILASMDYADRDVLLGTCGVFRMVTFDTRTSITDQSNDENKVNDQLGHWRLDQGQAHRGTKMSLMFVEGCASNLHCTVCLRGDTRARLRKVKRILLTAIHVAYSLGLENALLLDQCASYDDQSMDLLAYRLQQSQRPLSVGAVVPVGADGAPPPVIDEKEISQAREREWPRCVTRILARHREQQTVSRTRADDISGSNANALVHTASNSALIPSSSNGEISALTTAVTSTTRVPSMSVITGIEPIPGIGFPIISSSPFIEFTPAREDPVRRPGGRPQQGPSSNSSAGVAPRSGRLQPRQFLFGSCWLTNRWQCFPPEVKSIDFYTQTDKTLGQFLRENCFDLKLRCLNAKCKRDVLRHVLGYTHHQGRLVIMVKKDSRSNMPPPNIALSDPTAIRGSVADKIMMWSVCKSCSVMSPCIVMSDRTCNLSFGKFLELTFYDHTATCRFCPHSIHAQHIRFFSLGSHVASFEYEPVQACKISVKPRLAWHPSPIGLAPMNGMLPPSSYTAIDRADRELYANFALLAQVCYQVFNEFMYKIAEIDAQLEVQDHHRQLRMFKQRIGSEKDIFTAFFELLGVSPAGFSETSNGLPVIPAALLAVRNQLVAGGGVTKKLRIVSVLNYDIYDLNKVSRRLIILFGEWNRTLLDLCKQFFGKDLAKLRDPNPSRWEGKDEIKRKEKEKADKSDGDSSDDDDDDKDDEKKAPKKPPAISQRTESSQRLISQGATPGGLSPMVGPMLRRNDSQGPPPLMVGTGTPTAGGGPASIVAPAPKRVGLLLPPTVITAPGTSPLPPSAAAPLSSHATQAQTSAALTVDSAASSSTSGTNGTNATLAVPTPAIAVPATTNDRAQTTDGTSPNLSPAPSNGSSPASTVRTISDPAALGIVTQATPSPSPSPPPPESQLLSVPAGMTRATSGSGIGITIVPPSANDEPTNNAPIPASSPVLVAQRTSIVIDPPSSSAPAPGSSVPAHHGSGEAAGIAAPPQPPVSRVLPSPHTPNTPDKQEAKKKGGEKEPGLLGTFLAALGANDQSKNAAASKYDPCVSIESIVDRNIHMPAASFAFLKHSSHAHVMLPTLIGGAVIPVYDDEPSSMIAYTLCSLEHLAFINEMKVEDLNHLRPPLQLELMEPGPITKQGLRFALNTAKLKLNAFQPIASVTPPATVTAPSLSMAPVPLRAAQSLPNISTQPPASVIAAATNGTSGTTTTTATASLPPIQPSTSAPSSVAVGPIAQANNATTTTIPPSPAMPPMDSPPFTSTTPSMPIPGAGANHHNHAAMSPEPVVNATHIVPTPFELDRTISGNTHPVSSVPPSSPSDNSGSSVSSTTSGATMVVIAGQPTSTMINLPVSSPPLVSVNSTGGAIPSRGVFIGPMNAAVTGPASLTTATGGSSTTTSASSTASSTSPSPTHMMGGNHNILHVSDDEERDDDVQRAMLSDATTSFKFKFEDQIPNVQERVSFTVTVYYPKQFHALRVNYCGGDFDYLQSLSRCHKWKATGGKSGSTFSKTRDDRYILKYISRKELEMFQEGAVAYFGYMAKASFHNLPTVLVRMLGIYQISWKKGNNKDAMKSKYVIVMPNLFYDKKMERIFDLKGSVRNRYVKKKGRDAKRVLLDSNLMEYTNGFPIPLHEVSKAILRMSVFNDTLFLSGLEVVDYSILVGFDSENNELVVGIIDYIRQYTWDKVLETGVKSVGIIAGQGKPTVISPQSYKLRFRLAMDRYFMVVPDQSSKMIIALPSNAAPTFNPAPANTSNNNAATNNGSAAATAAAAAAPSSAASSTSANAPSTTSGTAASTSTTIVGVTTESNSSSSSSTSAASSTGTAATSSAAVGVSPTLAPAKAGAVPVSMTSFKTVLRKQK